MFRPLLPAAALALSLATLTAGPGVSADPLGVVAGEVLDVKARRLDVDVEGGTALLEGDVRAVLGGLEVLCQKVEIRYDTAPRVKWAKGSGGVTAKLKGIVATASSVELDVGKRRVDLNGGVRLTRGKGWVVAQRASIDIATLKVSLYDVKGSIPVQPPEK